jgi:hypothetical protein
MYLVKFTCCGRYIDNVNKTLVGGHDDGRGTFRKYVDEGGSGRKRNWREGPHHTQIVYFNERVGKGTRLSDQSSDCTWKANEAASTSESHPAQL